MSEHLRNQVKREFFKQPWDQIKFKTHFGVCIWDTLIRRGYQKTQDDDWTMFWSEKQLVASCVFEKCRLQPHQRVNHFRTFPQVNLQVIQLCRKDNLSRNLKKYKKQLQKEGRAAEARQFNFFPTTFHLPIEYNLFVQQFHKGTDKNIWILKPTAGSQGKGIRLFNQLKAVERFSDSQCIPHIVQRYISNPLLIGGKKFDLRIYVLCTSYHPLTVYLYRAGFARFTHFRYDQSKIDNTEIHLTNVAVQKLTDEYNADLGGKWFIDKLRIYLLSKFGAKAAEDCFIFIQSLIIKTLQSVQAIMSNDKHSFELYGFDIMLDSQLKPWIIEVNGSPSMRANTPSDCVLKCGLIDDVLTIIDMEGLLTGKQDQIGGFDIICRNDVPVTPEICRLGCINNRSVMMKRLAKEIEQRFLKEQLSKKDKSFDGGSRKVQDKRRSSTITKANIPIKRPNLVKPPVVQKPIVNIQPQPVKQVVKNNDADVKSVSSAAQSSTNKNWVIRKSNSIKKQSTPQQSVRIESVEPVMSLLPLVQRP